ncbi:PREDICTED: pentatricopeptide repeat-containing protein At4g19220, mitochondrial [Theobroma cacao]|uniref:Pentatricopeptide repeat-containing protein At4g19220, mitochondrial n=1 Tax=Theobroma cacao TaxID=3641 RepID=A0AB32VFU5_THECC|nr:PREDICTED: pentatricopeptide repeat-containing protein At4g19220, mitochondrial [Theobroma cacao]
MGSCWAVRSFRHTSKAIFPGDFIGIRRSFFCSALLPQHQNFSIRIVVSCKLKNPILFIESYGLFPNAHPLFTVNSLHFSTVLQPSAKMPQREPHQQYTQFYNVLDLLKSSVGRPNLVTATTAHCSAIKIGALAHLPACTSLLTAYSRAKDFNSSLALFDEFDDKDIIFRNAIISAAVENKSYGVAMQFFVEMVEVGCGFDSITLLLAVSALSHMKYSIHGKSLHCLSIKVGMLCDCSLCNALLDMYAKCGDLTSSESMFARMESRDAVSWNSMINGFLHNGHPAKALWCFKEMIYLGVRVDTVSLSSAISASAALEELTSGQVIHGWGIKLGYKSDISCSNSLISLYSKYGDTEASESVFNEMVYKDVISWNAMIGGFASNGKTLETFDLLYKMQLTGYAQPDMVTLVTLMSFGAERMLLREGRSIHGYAIRKQMMSDALVINSLLDMYSKCNSVVKAEFLFDMIPKRDLVSWNTMISCYSQNRQSKEAQSLFKKLIHQCSQWSLSTLLAVLPSCISPNSLQFGKSIHCWQLKAGFSSNILAVNSLTHMYINCGDLTAAFMLLEKISAKEDIACWNTIIVGCTQNGHFREALATFNMMRQETNVRHDAITLVNVISSCGNLALIYEGKSLHGLAIKTFSGSETRVQNALTTMYGRCGHTKSARSVFGFCSSRNLCSWNCMISAFSQNKDGRRALELFHFLEFEPNEITIVALLSACNQLGFLRQGKQIHGHVFRFGLSGNCYVSAALLDMYSNCGRLDVACQIFTRSKEKSVADWNSMISAYGYHSNGKKAVQLFHEMCGSGLRPSKSTFINLLSACSHSGLVNEGLWYYSLMLSEYGVEPVTEHQVCIVDMLGRAGKLQEAYEFIKQIAREPEPGVWGAMLSACNYHGNIEIGRKVAEHLFGLEPENVGYYISLANMYVSAGGWKDAMELRQTIQERKLKKLPAYSLIDVGSM